MTPKWLIFGNEPCSVHFNRKKGWKSEKHTLKLQAPAAPKTLVYPAVFAIPRGHRWHHRGCHHKVPSAEGAAFPIYWTCFLVFILRLCNATASPAADPRLGPQSYVATNLQAVRCGPRSASQLGHHSGLGIAHSTTYGDQQVDRNTWDRCRPQPYLRAHFKPKWLVLE